MRRAAEKGVEILPVDSEHSAIFQSLRAGKREEISRILLTASGGPFYGKSREELRYVTRDEVLAHPTWKMGKKITVDSATLMNKGFEVIEACHLFGVPEDKIEVLIHRESILHSAVEYIELSALEIIPEVYADLEKLSESISKTQEKLNLFKNDMRLGRADNDMERKISDLESTIAIKKKIRADMESIDMAVRVIWPKTRRKS